MKVLLSAYACEPNRGSEPGVGWNWAIEIAKRGHEVVVITRKNNQSSIESQSYDSSKITFVYYDPILILKFKKIIGVNLYYSLWQFNVGLKSKTLNKKYNFDLVHHITFGVFRQISYIPFFVKKPFAFGPVGGGELTPVKLMDSYKIKQKLKEVLRNLANYLAFYSPLYRLFLKKTDFIISKTDETSLFIPKKYRHKLKVGLEIGVGSLENRNIDKFLLERKLKTILFVGRFIYWKGIRLTLETFRNLTEVDPEFELIMIGKGEELNDSIEFLSKNNLNNYKIIDWLPQNELKEFYSNSTFMLFPSHHDSSGNVVLESLSYGLPVISLNIGGPAKVIGSIETIVNHENMNTNELSKKISNVILQILKDRLVYERLCKISYERSCELTWSKSVASIYSYLENELIRKNK